MTSDFTARQDRELEKARREFPDLHSPHEGLAVIMEEFEEFKAEVFKHQSVCDLDQMRKELVQIAAMCQRTYEDCL